MRHSIRRVTAAVIQISDKVGELHRVLSILDEAGLSMLAIASQRRRGTALMAIPDDVNTVRELAADQGIRITTRQVFLVEGSDRAGALVDITKAVTDAGINIEDIAALSAGHRYAGVITFADADLEAASEALGLGDTE